MNQAIVPPLVPETSIHSRRVLYGLGLIVALSFLYSAGISNENSTAMPLYLPAATGFLLVMFLAGAEYTLHQAQLVVMQATQQSARAQAELVAEERQRAFNQLWQTLADNRHAVQAPPKVLEDLTRLFSSDLVAVWAADRVGGFHLYGASALADQQRQRLEKLSQTSPCFEVLREQQRQLCITDIPGQTTKSFAWFCEEMEYQQVVLCPVLVRQNVVGVLGFFNKQKTRMAPRQREEMQLAANLFLCAL